MPPVAVDGCTYPGAANYNAAAKLDDVTCLFSGCLDSTAINYIAWANVDSENCIYASVCPEDVDEDGAVTVTDLLLILGAFGQLCD